MVHPARAAHRPDSGRPAAVGRLDGGHRWCSAYGGHDAPYYTVALAPASPRWSPIAAANPGAARDTWTGRGVLAGTTAVTAAWAWVLLGRSTTFLPWLRWIVLAVGVVAAVGLLVPRRRPGARGHGRRGGAGRRAGGPDGVRGADGRDRRTRAASRRRARARAAGSARRPDARARRRRRRAEQERCDRPGRGGRQDAPGSPVSRAGPGRSAGHGRPRWRAGRRTARGHADVGRTRWAAATMGSQGAAIMELRTGTAVMAIGGFMGSDPSPTLEQFQAYVANGDIRSSSRAAWAVARAGATARSASGCSSTHGADGRQPGGLRPDGADEPDRTQEGRPRRRAAGP